MQTCNVCLMHVHRKNKNNRMALFNRARRPVAGQMLDVRTSTRAGRAAELSLFTGDGAFRLLRGDRASQSTFRLYGNSSEMSEVAANMVERELKTNTRYGSNTFQAHLKLKNSHGARQWEDSGSIRFNVRPTHARLQRL